MTWRHNAGSDITTVPSIGTPPAPPPGEPAPRAPSSRRNLVFGLIMALMAVALAAVLVQRERDNSGDGGASAASPTSVTAAPITAAPVDQPPAILNTGEDWDSIVRSMIQFRDWLGRHPRPELLDSVLLPSAPGYSDAKLGLTNLATKGWRYDPSPAPVRVEIVRLNSRVDANTTVVFVRFGPAPEFRVVDQTGKVVSDDPATTTSNSVLWTLKLGTDGRWRLADVNPL